MLPASHPSSSHAALLQRIVAWEWDAAADRVVASPSLAPVYGVPAIEGVSRGFTLVHPDDHQEHEARVHAGIDRRRGYRSSFRIVNPTTSAVVWIEERAEAVDHGTFDPPELIGLAFDATVRHDRSAPTSLLATLDAVEEFGDVLLLLHAGARRQGSRRRRSVGGEWVSDATQAFTDLAALVTRTGAGAANVIAAETKALRRRLGSQL